jgi:IclR family acetate operon transcriptional repressor
VDHILALGKAILAHLPHDRIDEIVKRHGLTASPPNTITDRETLDDKLAQIREEGVAFDDEERIAGIRCIAAPILSNNDRVLGAISVAGPSNRIRDDQFTEKLPRRVLETVNVIELTSPIRSSDAH